MILSIHSTEASQTTSQPRRERLSLESVDEHMVCLMRLVLALSALLIIYIDPSEPNHYVALTYGALILYSVYSLILYLLSRSRRSPLPMGVLSWVDTACYLVLVSLSSGTSSIFFFFFFYAVLVASFYQGFAAGLCVALVSALLFTVIGFITSFGGQSFELNRFLLRPIYLLALGYMMAYWGGAEIRLKRRLALLKEVNTLSNPRFGINHTMSSIMKSVRAFYNADACLLVMMDERPGEQRLTRVGRADAGDEVQSEQLPERLAGQFFALPETVAVIYNTKVNQWKTKSVSYYAYDMAKNERTPEGRDESEKLAVTLDAASLLSVPLLNRGKAMGRLFLTRTEHSFDLSDIDFLIQIVEQVTPVLNNIRLLDRLASNAAEQERQKIARDLHDSVIQPYIGLQYKVAALRNKVAQGNVHIMEDLNKLFEVTSNEITGLRRYVGGLKEKGGREDNFLSAVRRYTAQFEENYGIDVKVECETELNINDRLAAEVIPLVHEGLSNIRKHTQATTSTIRLGNDGSHLILFIENDGASAETAAQCQFIPRSITERAQSLGGQARVGVGHEGRTRVTVRIPL
ncbi:MAG TPA: histidine kinase [Pyrinomonadaceae bacterium]